MHFIKIEGAGNDYVLVNAFEERVGDPAALARAVSDRHRGIGSDGLILVGPPRGAAVARMRIFNADGSEGRMCGNGLRCVIRWLVESGRATGPLVTVETAAGLRHGRLLSAARAEIDMGPPDFSPEAIPVLRAGDGSAPVELPLPAELGADPDAGFCVSIGNPHVVVRVAEPEAVDLPRFGGGIERSPELPDGANVHFLRLADAETIVARPWERGSGATRACGTGAVACAAVALRLGWLQAHRVAVQMPGGELHVRWSGHGSAWLEGPARLVFEGRWSGG